MKSVHYGLIVLFFFTPLLFGAVESWSLAVMEMSCIAFFFLWFFGTMKTGQPRVSLIRPPFLIPIGLLLSIAILQIIPLPPVFLKTISPQTYKIYHDTALHADTLPWLTLSLYPHATILEIVRLLAYICIYFLTVQILRERESIEKMATVILIIGVFVALTGIFQSVFWNGKLLWFRALNGGSSFGPYINRNHFAGLMEMVIPLSAGMTIHLLPSIRNNDGLRAFASDFLTHKQTNRLILFFASVVIMITALFLSLSRGGIVGLSLSMLFFGIMLSVRNSTRKKGWAIVGIFLIILFSVGWFGWKPIIERFERIKNVDTSSEYRIRNWKDSAEIIKAFPVFGTGLGTYEHVYPRYKTIPTQERWEHAHNDYIEGAVEFGIPGAGIGIYIIGAFYLIMFRVLKQRRSLNARLLGIGGMAGITGILIHGLTDFNLHIGTNGLFFSFLLGFTLAASHAKMREGDEGTLLELKEIHIPLKIRRPLIIVITVICMVVSAIPLLTTIADIHYALAKGPINEKADLLMAKSERLKRAEVLSPLDSRFPFAMGNVDSILERKIDAVRNYTKAVMLNPVNGEYLQMLGIAYDAAGKRESAERYIKLGVLYDPTSAWIHKNYALWLLSKGRKEAAMTEMKNAISLDPANTRKYITAMVLSRLTSKEMRDVIPENPVSLILYGRYREEVGDTEGAKEEYEKVLLLDPANEYAQRRLRKLSSR